MNNSNNNKGKKQDGKTSKAVKRECKDGDDCGSVSPLHLKEFSHPHLEKILDNYNGEGEYPIPKRLRSQNKLLEEQLQVILEKQIYTPQMEVDSKENLENDSQGTSSSASSSGSANKKKVKKEIAQNDEAVVKQRRRTRSQSSGNTSAQRGEASNAASSEMAAKHAASAPYYIFFTKITDSPMTHDMPNSITFPEILDRSLGELECSLQITFLLNLKWLYEQYSAAGYGNKNLIILYDKEESTGVRKNNIKTHQVRMGMYAAHHTKMMLLCYEDGSLRVVVSTANLYPDDWRNRTQGLWLSQRCPPLSKGAAPDCGDSPTMFKESLLQYLNSYSLSTLDPFIDRVSKCDFSHINVFLVTSAPGSHSDPKCGLTRIGNLLQEHCHLPPAENPRWPLIAQATSLGSLGKGPEIWLTGAFLDNFTKIKVVSEPEEAEIPEGPEIPEEPEIPETPSPPVELKLIYPSKENVNQSYDGDEGGRCLSYSKENYAKQPWLSDFFHQWRALSTHRNRSVPHVKSYTRVSPDNKMAAYFLLTSANVSKAAWGSVNKGNRKLRVRNYEAGVLFLPKFIIDNDLFPLEDGAENRLVLPYDLPPVKYTEEMSPYISSLPF